MSHTNPLPELTGVQAFQNTDREVWRETPGDFYSNSVHLTATGGLGINVGGTVHVKPPAEWHRLASGARSTALVALAPEVDDALREVGKWLNEQPNRPIDRVAVAVLCAALSCSTAAQPAALPEPVLQALRFYANGDHYITDDAEDFDTVSGEPENWLCSGLEDSSTMIETGRIARFALTGEALNWIDGGEDQQPKPVAGEAFGPAAAQPVEPMVTPTEAVVGFASWLSCRPGTLSAGECHDASPLAEVVHEYVVGQGWPGVRDEAFPHNLKRMTIEHPPAASGDSTPPSLEVHMDREHGGLAFGKGDPSGALRTEPEEAGQGRWIAVTERMPENDDEVLVWVTSPWAKTAYAAIDSWHMHREDPTGMGGPTLEMGYMWREYEAEDITHWQRVEPPQAASGSRGD